MLNTEHSFSALATSVERLRDIVHSVYIPSVIKKQMSF